MVINNICRYDLALYLQIVIPNRNKFRYWSAIKTWKLYGVHNSNHSSWNSSSYVINWKKINWFFEALVTSAKKLCLFSRKHAEIFRKNVQNVVSSMRIYEKVCWLPFSWRENMTEIGKKRTKIHSFDEFMKHDLDNFLQNHGTVVKLDYLHVHWKWHRIIMCKW